MISVFKTFPGKNEIIIGQIYVG